MTAKTAATETAASEWTAIPPAPKPANYWQNGAYTLRYVGGWDVLAGTISSKAEAEGKPVLHHERKAADAKQWAEAQAAKPKRTQKPAGANNRNPRTGAPVTTETAKADDTAENTTEGDSK